MTERLDAVAPVRKSIVVRLDQQQAFALFTTGMSSWWPVANYRIGEVAVERIVLEPVVGGRWFERGIDGSECDWGTVLQWDAPNRVVLAWQISESWQYDPDLTTEVEVRFTATEANETLVELEHRRLEELGEAAATMQGIFDGEGGWTLLLREYAGAVRQP